MNWNQIVDKVEPYIVKIATPQVSGTGFLCLYNDDKTWCGIATALHVVDYADEWRQPIKIIHQSKNILFLKETDRVVFPNRRTDSAMILFKKPPKHVLPTELLGLRPLDQILDIGSEVGWLGYPYLEPDKLCFFSGCISARNEARKYYLIDGVSINGVSGGPVLYSSESNGIEIIGVICVYRANMATGMTPGLSIAQDVSHFHGVIKTIKSIDDAEKKKQELKEQEKKDGDGGKNLPPSSAQPSNPPKTD